MSDGPICPSCNAARVSEWGGLAKCLNGHVWRLEDGKVTNVPKCDACGEPLDREVPVRMDLRVRECKHGHQRAVK